jgi:hypothetical protein
MVPALETLGPSESGRAATPFFLDWLAEGLRASWMGAASATGLAAKKEDASFSFKGHYMAQGVE